MDPAHKPRETCLVASTQIKFKRTSMTVKRGK